MFLCLGTRCIRDNECSVDFVVNWLCYSLQEDIDQQMYTDTRSYISKIMTDVMSNIQVNNASQIQQAAYFSSHITQFKVALVCAEIKHCVSCSDLFVHLVILIPDQAFS